jgi:DNA polymerase
MAASPPTDDDERDQAIALLARGLEGALRHALDSGLTHLPRPRVPAPVTSTMQMGATQSNAVEPAPAVARPAAPKPRAPEPVAPAIVPVTSLNAPPALGSPADRLHILHHDVIGDCTRCKLHRGRSKVVFGVGNPAAELVFVGEGPGAEEDRQGVPFVGAAGQLLDKMIEAMGFSRGDIYICNVVKCRPPNNRDPEPDEVAACEGFLQQQLAIVKPKVIVTLGRFAAHTLLHTSTPITRLRGTWHKYQGVDVMPTYHPSFLLRQETPDRKREAWSDLQQVMKVFGKSRH